MLLSYDSIEHSADFMALDASAWIYIPTHETYGADFSQARCLFKVPGIS
jgi:hypothetical protein